MASVFFTFKSDKDDSEVSLEKLNQIRAYLTNRKWTPCGTTSFYSGPVRGTPREKLTAQANALVDLEDMISQTAWIEGGLRNCLVLIGETVNLESLNATDGIRTCGQDNSFSHSPGTIQVTSPEATKDYFDDRDGQLKKNNPISKGSKKSKPVVKHNIDDPKKTIPKKAQVKRNESAQNKVCSALLAPISGRHTRECLRSKEETRCSNVPRKRSQVNPRAHADVNSNHLLRTRKANIESYRSPTVDEKCQQRGCFQVETIVRDDLRSDKVWFGTNINENPVEKVTV